MNTALHIRCTDELAIAFRVLAIRRRVTQAELLAQLVTEAEKGMQ